MALTPQPLFRAQDVGTPTTLLPVTPRNWRKWSNKTGDIAKANPNEAKPRYDAAGAAADWLGNAYGDDQSQATSNVAVAHREGAPNDALPPIARTQQHKAVNLGTTIVVDVGRRRGGIAPNQPYPTKADTPVAAPTVTSLSPNTAVAGAATPQFGIKIIGTGFTVWSEVWIGGVPAPTNIYKYVSPTEIRCQLSPASSFAGTITVAVKDHGVTSNNQTFTWT